MRHDRRIEERRRFECVFPAEKRANQEPARCRERPIGKDMCLDPPVNAQQRRVQVTVPGAKFAAHDLGVSPTKVRKVPQESCQLPWSTGFSALTELPRRGLV